MNNTGSNEWITDSLPKPSETVWITYLNPEGTRKVYKAWQINGNWFTPGYKQIYNQILAWMPIERPASYTGEGNIQAADEEMINHYINER